MTCATSINYSPSDPRTHTRLFNEITPLPAKKSRLSAPKLDLTITFALSFLIESVKDFHFFSSVRYCLLT